MARVGVPQSAIAFQGAISFTLGFAVTLGSLLLGHWLLWVPLLP